MCERSAVAIATARTTRGNAYKSNANGATSGKAYSLNTTRPTLGLTVAPQKERKRMDEQSIPAEVPLVGHTVEPVVGCLNQEG